MANWKPEVGQIVKTLEKDWFESRNKKKDRRGISAGSLVRVFKISLFKEFGNEYVAWVETLDCTHQTWTFFNGIRPLSHLEQLALATEDEWKLH